MVLCASIDRGCATPLLDQSGSRRKAREKSTGKRGRQEIVVGVLGHIMHKYLYKRGEGSPLRNRGRLRLVDLVGVEGGVGGVNGKSTILVLTVLMFKATDRLADKWCCGAGKENSIHYD